ncbi:hypothetical protein DOT_3231 [Desulfosporosinus sp. OT]|nr:hypothetical protein DOT_3231 [Desulfosporosinus sp. OT]
MKIRDNFTIDGKAEVVKLKSLETFRNGKIKQCMIYSN